MNLERPRSVRAAVGRESAEFRMADVPESRAMTLKKAHLYNVKRIAKIWRVGDPPVIRTPPVVEPKQTLAPDCDQFLSDRMALHLVILSCSIF